MALKTLKDLKDHWQSKSGRYHVGGLVSKEHLKQEAIAWIKADKNDKLNLHESFIMSPTVIEWIKNFFNISEEEVRKHKIK